MHDIILVVGLTVQRNGGNILICFREIPSNDGELLPGRQVYRYGRSCGAPKTYSLLTGFSG